MDDKEVIEIVEWVDPEGNSKILIHRPSLIDYPLPPMNIKQHFTLTKAQIKPLVKSLERLLF